MINSFGIFVRKLRIDNEEFLFDMAKKLGVSSAFLSATETSKKSIPKYFEEKLTELYNLDYNQKEELSKAIKNSILDIKITLKDMKINDRELLLKFARSFEEFSEEDKRLMANMISKRSEDK